MVKIKLILSVRSVVTSNGSVILVIWKFGVVDWSSDWTEFFSESALNAFDLIVEETPSIVAM